MCFWVKATHTELLDLFQDLYSVPRTILPHGASFHGHPVTLHITYESTKDTFTLEVTPHTHFLETKLPFRLALATQTHTLMTDCKQG